MPCPPLTLPGPLAPRYNHLDVFRVFTSFLRNDGWTVCAIYCLDCHFLTDAAKYIAGCMQASTMACLPYLLYVCTYVCMHARQHLLCMHHAGQCLSCRQVHRLVYMPACVLGRT